MQILVLIIIILLIYFWSLEMKKKEIQIEYYAENSLDRQVIYSRLFKNYVLNFYSYIYKIDFFERCKDLAKFSLAQAILETGNFQKIIMYVYKDKQIQSKNLFNIKYGSLSSTFRNYYRIYDKYCYSIEDYSKLIMTKNLYRQYLEKFFNDEMTFEQAWRRICLIYAEDKKYFEKIKSIYDRLPNFEITEVSPCEGRVIKLEEVI